MPAPKFEELVAIASIVKPKGLKGEVVADILTDFPGRFENLERVILDGEESRQIGLEYFRFEKHRVVLKFDDVDSIEEAEALRGLGVCVEESDAVELEEDEFYDWALEGCLIVETNGSEIGRVSEVFRAGERVNLVVEGVEKEYMIPFVRSICTEVDTDEKRITVDLPEGLLDF